MATKMTAAMASKGSAASADTPVVRVGIGGWNYEPWRTTFYPKEVAKKNQLAWASTKVTAIEINATYYRTQSPASFAKWRDGTPEGFVFSVKANRFATHRRVLAEGADSIAHFLNSGLAELGPKLGPILWQFMPTKKFDPEDFGAFLALLPKEVDGVPLRHALDVRHESFRTEAFVHLARSHGAAIVCSDSDDYPMMGDVTADFVYARLMRARADVETGYDAGALDQWTRRAIDWTRGRTIAETGPVVAPAPQVPRDVYIFFIDGAKERAPAGAMAMLERLEAARRPRPGPSRARPRTIDLAQPETPRSSR